MLLTEELNQLWLQLSESPDLGSQLRDSLQSLAASAKYREWAASEPRNRLVLPSETTPISSSLLHELGLVRNGELQVKVNEIDEKFFITDGAWVSHLMRVFPDPDEAQVLLNFAGSRGYGEWANWVIDPAAGCGHTPLGFTGQAKRISCDANVRAITYAHINARINGFGSDRFFGLMNDMRTGFPASLQMQGNVLFLSNVPFAPSPREGALALNSAGGSTGADLQAACFRLVRDFHCKRKLPVRACFLTWTLGHLGNQDWEVPQLCRETFDDSNISFQLIDHDYDAPELPNPAPLHDMLMSLASSQYTVQSGDRSVQIDYESLSRSLSQRGFTHIAYGMLECNLS